MNIRQFTLWSSVAMRQCWQVSKAAVIARPAVWNGSKQSPAMSAVEHATKHVWVKVTAQATSACHLAPFDGCSHGVPFRSTDQRCNWNDDPVCQLRCDTLAM